MKLLIDMGTALCRILKNAQVNIYSLADLNTGQCVELTCLEGKLGRFIMLTFLRYFFFILLLLKVKLKVYSTQTRIVFSSYLYL